MLIDGQGLLQALVVEDGHECSAVVLKERCGDVLLVGVPGP